MSTSSLARFQSDFSRALFHRQAQNESAWQAQPAFAVYRNTVMKGCIDTLEANYPAIARLVGREWFRSAAAVYVGDHPPHDGALVSYGETFPQFLRDFEPAGELTYLPDVARLDRFWTESHTALDARPLTAARLAQLSPYALTQCRLQPHPAARWAWFAHQPIYSIWERNRSEVEVSSEIEWQGDGALLTRPTSAVTWQAATLAECAFLDACAAGQSLSEAAEHAQQAEPAADLMAAIGCLLNAGAIAALLDPHMGKPS